MAGEGRRREADAGAARALGGGTAKQYELLTPEQVMVRWAEVTSRRSQWDNDDDFEVEEMAVFSVLGVKMRERSKVLRAAGFEYGEPVQ